MSKKRSRKSFCERAGCLLPLRFLLSADKKLKTKTMKKATLNEAIESSINFFEYTMTIDGREWLRNAAIWTSYTPNKKKVCSFDFLAAYVEKNLFNNKVPIEIIENSFFVAIPDRMQRVELIMFLDDIIKERESLN